MHRRTFLQGCCAGIVAMNGSRLGGLLFADGPSVQRDIVVSVFLRGGIDALSFLVPYADANYAVARARLKMNGGQVLPLDGTFGLHPSAAALKTLFDQQQLALVCATGSTDATRSHFEAQDNMERAAFGTDAYQGGGWLGRYVRTLPSDAIFKAVSQGSSTALALDGYTGALALSSADGFTLNGDGSHIDDLRRSLRMMYATDPRLGAIAQRTLDAADYVDFASVGTYVPTPGVTYPTNSSIATSLKAVAQMIRMDVGLQAVTVDFGGWDTHESQASGNNPTTGRFADLIGQLSSGLDAFWKDIVGYQNRVTVVVMSEFGRRVKENDNLGTDHGHGGMMMILSGNITQKKVWGTWPGLATEQLFENVDVQVTTDFRRILAEVLNSRLAVGNVNALFPGYTYPGALGIFNTLPTTTPVTGSGLILQ